MSGITDIGKIWSKCGSGTTLTLFSAFGVSSSSTFFCCFNFFGDNGDISFDIKVNDPKVLRKTHVRKRSVQMGISHIGF